MRNVAPVPPPDYDYISPSITTSALPDERVAHKTNYSKGSREQDIHRAAGYRQILRSENLTWKDTGVVLDIFAERSIQLTLPKITKNKGKNFIIRRSDCSSYEVSIYPATGDTIEKGSPDGPWMGGNDGLVCAFGLGFSDTVVIGNDEKNNWFFLIKPRIDTVMLYRNSGKIIMNDLDRTVILTSQTGKSIVVLPTAVQKIGRNVTVKNHPKSYHDVTIVTCSNREHIDAENEEYTLHPGEAVTFVSDDITWYIIGSFYHKNS